MSNVIFPKEDFARLVYLAGIKGMCPSDRDIFERAMDEVEDLYESFGMQEPRKIRSKNVLYILRAGPFYKVGISINVEARIKSIQSSNPYPIEFVGLYNIPRGGGLDRTNAIEKLVHSHLSDYRTSGEWFKCDLAHIQRAVFHIVRPLLNINGGPEL